MTMTVLELRRAGLGGDENEEFDEEETREIP